MNEEYKKYCIYIFFFNINIPKKKYKKDLKYFKF